MKKALAPAAKPKHKGKPQGVVDIVPRPFSFCKGSGSPCPITPPELEMLPHAGPRGDQPGASREGGLPFPRESPGFYTRRPPPVSEVFPWASAGWGDTVVKKSFLCVAFCALRVARTMPTNPFSIGVFRRLRRGKGPFPAGRVLSLPCGERGLPRASAGLCARVCVSFPGCQGTPRVKHS